MFETRVIYIYIYKITDKFKDDNLSHSFMQDIFRLQKLLQNMRNAKEGHFQKEDFARFKHILLSLFIKSFVLLPRANIDCSKLQTRSI